MKRVIKPFVKLASQYNLSNLEPNIQVWNVNVRGDRSLTLQHVPQDRIPLHDGYPEVLKHLHRLWGFDVILEEVKDTGRREILATCPPSSTVHDHGIS